MYFLPKSQKEGRGQEGGEERRLVHGQTRKVKQIIILQIFQGFKLEIFTMSKTFFFFSHSPLPFPPPISFISSLSTSSLEKMFHSFFLNLSFSLISPLNLTFLPLQLKRFPLFHLPFMAFSSFSPFFLFFFNFSS